MTTIPSSRAAVATALFLALFGGCVLHDGKISPGEQRIIERKFEPNPRRHGTEGSAKVQPQSSHDSSEACGSEEDPMVRLGCLVFFYDGFTVMDAPGVQDKVACATCHDPANNFSDGRARASRSRHASTESSTAASLPCLVTTCGPSASARSNISLKRALASCTCQALRGPTCVLLLIG